MVEEVMTSEVTTALIRGWVRVNLFLGAGKWNFNNVAETRWGIGTAWNPWPGRCCWIAWTLSWRSPGWMPMFATLSLITAFFCQPGCQRIDESA